MLPEIYWLCVHQYKTYVHFLIGVTEHGNEQVQCNQHGSEAVCSEQQMACDFSYLSLVTGVEGGHIHVTEQCPK